VSGSFSLTVAPTLVSIAIAPANASIAFKATQQLLTVAAAVFEEARGCCELLRAIVAGVDGTAVLTVQ